MITKNNPVIDIKVFTKQGDAAAYKIYRELEYEVFVTECGWTTLADPCGEKIAIENPFDAVSTFFLAVLEDGTTIGIVRANIINTGIPHPELFEQHLSHTEFGSMLDSLCSINAMAIIPEYRRKICTMKGSGWTGTAARLLILGVLHHLQSKGIKGAILSTDASIPARLYKGVGFLLIDKPAITALRQDPILNLGLVFGSPGHIKARKECGITPENQPLAGDSLRLLRYFESRQ